MEAGDSAGGADPGAQQVAAGFLLAEWVCLPGLLQLHGGRARRHASGPIFRWSSSDSERVRGNGSPGGRCHRAGFGPLRLGSRFGEDQILQAILVGGKFLCPGGKLVEAEDIGEKTRGRGPVKRSGGGGRHHFLNHVVEVERRLTLVFGEEVISAER